MVEVRRHLDLAKEPLGANFRRYVGAENLYGDGAVVAEITSEKHNRHAAFTKRALDDVTAGKTRFEALLQVVHESTILGRSPAES